MGSVTKQENGRYRARYRDAQGKEHLRRFAKSLEARAWVKTQEAAVVRGDHVDRQTAQTTVSAWVSTWLEGYATRRPGTVRQAEVHARVIVAEWGERRLGDVRPSEVNGWVARLGERYADSTRYAIYRRFAQIMGDAVADGLIPRSPCSRKTSPPQGKQRPGVATVEAVWELVDAMPVPMRPALLLGAFAGLRIGGVRAPAHRRRLHARRHHSLRAVRRGPAQVGRERGQHPHSARTRPGPRGLRAGPRRADRGGRPAGETYRALDARAGRARGAGECGRPAGRLPFP